MFQCPDKEAESFRKGHSHLPIGDSLTSYNELICNHYESCFQSCTFAHACMCLFLSFVPVVLQLPSCRCLFLWHSFNCTLFVIRWYPNRCPSSPYISTILSTVLFRLGVMLSLPIIIFLHFLQFFSVFHGAVPKLVSVMADIYNGEQGPKALEH